MFPLSVFADVSCNQLRSIKSKLVVNVSFVIKFIPAGSSTTARTKWF